MPRQKRVALTVVAAAVVGTIGAIYGCGGRYAHGQVYSLIRYAHADVDDLGCTMSALSRYGYCTIRAKPEAVTQLASSLDLIPYNAKHDRPAQNGDLVSILFGKDPSIKLYVERHSSKPPYDITQRVSGIYDVQLYVQSSTGLGVFEVGD